MTHEIKLLEYFCDPVLEGKKTFEIRQNDRGYQTGDFVRFQPVDKNGLPYHHPIENNLYEITYVLSGWFINMDYVAFSIKKVEE